MESDKPLVKSPAFQMYPADFLSDKNTLVMSTVEIGAYCLLLFVCWDEGGLPDNAEDLAGIARLPVRQFQPMWERHIERCFQKREDGKWSHKRLEKEREKQAINRAKRQAAGAKGAETRWQTDSNAMAMPEQENGKRIANDSLSDFSLQSSSSDQIQQRAKRAPDAKGTRLPEDFSVTLELRAWAKEHAPHVDLDKTLEEFHDFWKAVPGAKGRKLDWPATFRNRVRELEGRKNGNGARASGPEHPNAYRPGKMIL